MRRAAGNLSSRITKVVERRIQRMLDGRARLQFVDGLSFKISAPTSVGGTAGGGGTVNPPSDPTASLVLKSTVTVPAASAGVYLVLGDKDDIEGVSGHFRAVRGTTVTTAQFTFVHDGTSGIGGLVSEFGANTGIYISAEISGGNFRLKFADTDAPDGNDTVFQLTYTLTEA